MGKRISVDELAQAIDRFGSLRFPDNENQRSHEIETTLRALDYEELLRVAARSFQQLEVITASQNMLMCMSEVQSSMFRAVDEKMSVIRDGRKKGASAKAAIEAARFSPALEQYKNDARMQRMSFLNAAIELVTKHGHNVSITGLARKLSRTKKLMSAA